MFFSSSQLVVVEIAVLSIIGSKNTLTHSFHLNNVIYAIKPIDLIGFDVIDKAKL